MKKISLSFLLLACVFSMFAQNTESSSNKVKRFFYRDGIISMEKWYGDDKKLDSVKTYHKNGKPDEKFYYLNGRYHGVSYKFNREGKKVTTWKFNNYRLVERIDHIIEFNKKDEEKIKKLHTTLKILNENLKENRGDYRSRMRRADIRLKLGNKVLALADFNWIKYRINKLAERKKVKPSGAQLSKVYDVQASLYSSLEMDNYASHYRYKASKAAPEDNRLKYNLAAYLYNIKSYRLSLHYLNEVLKQWKGHAFSHRLLAAIYTDLEDYKKAKHHIDIAFPKEKNLLKNGFGKLEQDIRTLRGFISHNLGQSKIGIDDLKEAIRLNEDNSFAHRNLGVVYYDLGENKLACKHLQKAKKLGYEKIHDRDDLQAYLELSCENAEAIEKSAIGEENKIELPKLADKPFVYPNPGKDIIRVRNFPYENFNYEIYDFSSKLVSKNTATKNSLNISSLPQGVYILRISKNNLFETFRIVKD